MRVDASDLLASTCAVSLATNFRFSRERKKRFVLDANLVGVATDFIIGPGGPAHWGHFREAPKRVSAVVRSG